MSMATLQIADIAVSYSLRACNSNSISDLGAKIDLKRSDYKSTID